MRSVPSHICKPPSEASLAHKLLHSYPHSLVNGPSDVPSTLSSLLLPPSQLFLLPFQLGVGSQKSLVLKPGGLGGDRGGLTYGREDLGEPALPKLSCAEERPHLLAWSPEPTRLGGGRAMKTDFWLGGKLSLEAVKKGMRVCCSRDAVSDETWRLVSFGSES